MHKHHHPYKSLPLLLTGLLASPLLAAPRPPELTAPDQPISIPAPAPLTAEVAADLQQQANRLAANEPLDAHGMQQLQRQLARDIHAHLDRALLAQRTFPAQFIAQPPPAKIEKAAFLGITTSAVTPILRDQLNLQPGMGLIVDYVEKDSPADAAGLKVHDILEKLDDQWLINPQQLAVLVRSKKPGDALALTVIHGGQRVTISPKLVEKDLPTLDSLQSQDPYYNFNPSLIPQVNNALNPGISSPAMPGAITQQSSSLSVRVNPDGSQTRTLADDQHVFTLEQPQNGDATLTIKDRTPAGATIYSGPANSDKVPPEFRPQVDSLTKAANQRIIINLNNNGQAASISTNGVAGITNSSALSREDGEHQITLSTKDGNRTLKIKDLKSGQTLFDGPYNSDADLKALPDAIQSKVKALVTKAP